MGSSIHTSMAKHFLFRKLNVDNLEDAIALLKTSPQEIAHIFELIEEAKSGKKHGFCFAAGPLAGIACLIGIYWLIESIWELTLLHG